MRIESRACHRHCHTFDFKDFLTRTETNVTFRKRRRFVHPSEDVSFSNYNQVIQQNFFVQFPLLLILLKGYHYEVHSRDYWRKGSSDEPWARTVPV